MQRQSNLVVNTCLQPSALAWKARYQAMKAAQQEATPATETAQPVPTPAPQARKILRPRQALRARR